MVLYYALHTLPIYGPWQRFAFPVPQPDPKTFTSAEDSTPGSSKKTIASNENGAPCDPKVCPNRPEQLIYIYIHNYIQIWSYMYIIMYIYIYLVSNQPLIWMNSFAWFPIIFVSCSSKRLHMDDRLSSHQGTQVSPSHWLFGKIEGIQHHEANLELRMI